jgi:hypothetical protein
LIGRVHDGETLRLLPYWIKLNVADAGRKGQGERLWSAAIHRRFSPLDCGDSSPLFFRVPRLRRKKDKAVINPRTPKLAVAMCAAR